jgi:hypothetical protein
VGGAGEGKVGLKSRKREKSRVLHELAPGIPVGLEASVRTWGWRGALCASVVCLAASAFYYTEFLAAPVSLHIYGIYYGLQDTGDLFAEYAILSLLIAGWVRLLSMRLVLATGMGVALLVLNVAFTWTSGVLGYVLVAIPSWLPQGVIVEYLSLIQFPAARSALDFYYLGWLMALFLISMAFFRSGLAKRLVHSLEFAVLALLALPVEVYLFDRREFNIHVMDAQARTSLQWFTNAELLASLLVALFVLAVVDSLVFREGKPILIQLWRRICGGPGGI